MKLRKFKLTLDVDVRMQGEQAETIVRGLNEMVVTAMSNGVITRGLRAEVQRWDFDVEHHDEREVGWWFVPTGDFDQEPRMLDADNEMDALREAVAVGMGPGYLTIHAPNIDPMEEALARETLTEADEWDEVEGPVTGVGIERWFRHPGSACEAYVCDDQGHITVTINPKVDI